MTRIMVFYLLILLFAVWCINYTKPTPISQKNSVETHLVNPEEEKETIAALERTHVKYIVIDTTDEAEAIIDGSGINHCRFKFGAGYAEKVCAYIYSHYRKISSRNGIYLFKRLPDSVFVWAPRISSSTLYAGTGLDHLSIDENGNASLDGKWVRRNKNEKE